MDTGNERKKLRVLLVEDSPFDAELLAARINRGGFDATVRRVDTARGLEQALASDPWDVILSDHNMPHFSSTEALAIVKAQRHLDVPFLIVSGSIGEELAVESMRAGASDYILKENLTRLVPAIERELRDAADRRERRKAETALLAQQEQLRIAREIQQRLFPARPPELPGFDIAGVSLPADATGGDYFDYIARPDGSLLAVIGDVSGHGLGAALLVTDTREALRALALAGSAPCEMVLQADRLLREDFGDEHFITLLCVVLDPAAGALAHVSAGHPAGFVMGADGRIVHTLDTQGPALCLPDAPPRVPPLAPLALRPGDVAVLLTDGILEARAPSGEEFGAARLHEAVRALRDRPAAGIVDGLCAAVRLFTGSMPQQDDITAVVIKYTGRTS